MELYIQMGHGMQSMSKDLLSDWGSSTVILSPLNISPKSLSKFSTEINEKNGKILFDPQLYYPEKNHKNLTKYNYWSKKNITDIKNENYDFPISELANLNIKIRATAFVLPSLVTQEINHQWEAMQQKIIDTAQKYAFGMDLIHTIALGGNVLSDSLKVEAIIQCAEQWGVHGVYIVCEHPEQSYLVDNPLWISNLLALTTGIKRQRKKVIVGYANHQMLCLSLSKCDAIASGNFLNVRWFRPDRFKDSEDDEVSRRSTWYYFPQALSEYKVTFLDIAQRMDILNAMAPPSSMTNPYCEMLFSGGVPSSTGYKEGEAQRHYLHCLQQQCLAATKKTYAETRDFYLSLLETAEQILRGLRKRSISGQDRDFSEILDVNRAAVAAHDKDFFFPLSNEWDTL